MGIWIVLSLIQFIYFVVVVVFIRAVMNIGVQVFAGAAFSVLWGYAPRSGNAGSRGNAMFSF